MRRGRRQRRTAWHQGLSFKEPLLSFWALVCRIHKKREVSQTYRLTEADRETWLTVKSKQNQVTTLVIETTIAYEDLGLEEQDDAEAMMEAVTNKFNGLTGIGLRLDIQADQVTQTMTLVLDKMEQEARVMVRETPVDPAALINGLKASDAADILRDAGAKKIK